MDLTIRIDIDLPYDEAVARVREALAEQGFGVLTEIDVRRTLKEKIDVDVAPEIILGACIPRLAHRALESDPRIAALLPCNVVVRTEGGRTVVEALDPNLLAQFAGEGVVPVAEEAATLINAALEKVATG